MLSWYQTLFRHNTFAWHNMLPSLDLSLRYNVVHPMLSCHLISSWHPTSSKHYMWPLQNMLKHHITCYLEIIHYPNMTHHPDLTHFLAPRCCNIDVTRGNITGNTVEMPVYDYSYDPVVTGEGEERGERESSSPPPPPPLQEAQVLPLSRPSLPSSPLLPSPASCPQSLLPVNFLLPMLCMLM